MSDLTIDKLGSAIQDFFSSQYSPVAGAASVFAAQPGGLPVDTSTFASNLLLASQEINDLADVTARVLADQFWPTLVKATGLYEILLSCMPSSGMTGDQLAEFGKLRGNADADYHNQLAGITATPSNWWDITASGNWTTHTTSSDQVSGSLPTPILHWNWRVLPPAHVPILRTGLRPGAFPIDQALPVAAPRSSLPVTSAIPAAPVEMTELHQAVTVPVAGLLNPVSFTAQPVSMIASQRAVAQLVSVSSMQTVEAEHLSVSFDYCLVMLSRPWWDGLFVATKGWYIPTYRAGDLSMGAVDGSGGQCPAIPSAMFLVRNVTISGSWSEQDRTVIPNAASFGPISLIGRSIDSSLTITIPGMQLVGWMVDALPVLPPMSDPDLSTLGLTSSDSGLDALPTLSAGQQGPVVARLQGLLRAAIPGSTDASLAIDGNYGPGTVSAVQTFQQQNGLNATGLVDEATWQKLLGLS
jgi:hypothetical protein